MFLAIGRAIRPHAASTLRNAPIFISSKPFSYRVALQAAKKAASTKQTVGRTKAPAKKAAPASKTAAKPAKKAAPKKVAGGNKTAVKKKVSVVKPTSKTALRRPSARATSTPAAQRAKAALQKKQAEERAKAARARQRVKDAEKRAALKEKARKLRERERAKAAKEREKAKQLEAKEKEKKKIQKEKEVKARKEQNMSAGRKAAPYIKDSLVNEEPPLPSRATALAVFAREFAERAKKEGKKISVLEISSGFAATSDAEKQALKLKGVELLAKQRQNYLNWISTKTGAEIVAANRARDAIRKIYKAKGRSVPLKYKPIKDPRAIGGKQNAFALFVKQEYEKGLAESGPAKLNLPMLAEKFKTISDSEKASLQSRVDAINAELTRKNEKYLTSAGL